MPPAQKIQEKGNLPPPLFFLFWLCLLFLAAPRLSLVVVQGCLIVVASLVIEHGQVGSAVAPQHVESSQTRDWTRVPCLWRQILNHCTTREVLPSPLDKGEIRFRKTVRTGDIAAAIFREIKSATASIKFLPYLNYCRCASYLWYRSRVMPVSWNPHQIKGKNVFNTWLKTSLSGENFCFDHVSTKPISSI